MYTQCPKCQAAFRITAQVLQQARGQVLCGSCQNAFNALDHLSEEPPSASSPAADEQSKALLETLNRLAGPEDVRIEDTGVEWLVVDEADAVPETSPPRDATGSMRWVLEDAGESPPDDVPQVSDEVPVEIDLETADTTEHPIVDEQEAMAFVPEEEPRYDDNTPLPDDFEEQHNYVRKPDHPLRRATDASPETVVVHDAQTELELSEPGDWTDLLDEVGDAATVSGEASVARRSG